MKTFYVGYPQKTPNFTKIEDALAALSCEALSPQTFPAPLSEAEPVTVKIAPGIYKEQLVVSRPNVTLEGEDAQTTLLTCDLGAREILADGLKRGTFRTASVRIDAPDFTAKNLTFQNSAGYGYEVGQALALYVDGDRIIFENCRFLGSQDTLFTAPLPLTELEPGGFRGPGEHKPRIMGRHYYRNCFIQGDIDFIFGGAVCYFDGCTLFSKMPVGSTSPICGYITAASTPKDSPFGYVFQNCHLTGDCPPGSVYLGRPWREFAKTVFLNCEMGEHIHPEGWTDWNKPHGNFYFAEYGSYGVGGNSENRASFSHQLTKKEAALYTIKNVLGVPDGWMVSENYPDSSKDRLEKCQ